MAKDTRPRSGTRKTNDVPPFGPLPANPPPVIPKPMRFTQSAHVPQTRSPSNRGGSNVSPTIKPLNGRR